MSPIFLGPQSSYQPRSSTPGLGYRAPLLRGEAGTAQTIALMRKLVQAAVTDQNFVRFASELVRGVQSFDDIGEAQAVYSWVKRNIRYTKDPVTVEKLYPPQELLKIKAGDCDDIAMLLGALMIALGYPARLITISASADNPDEFSHVYLESEVPPGSGNWIPMDAARLDAQFGVEPPMWYRKRAWSLTDSSYQDLSGCNCPGQCKCSSVGSYRFGLAGLGQDSGIPWSTITAQSIQEIPAIISAVQGGGSTQITPYGTVAARGPYSSFATQYTPGYGVPYAGYPSAVSPFGPTTNIWPWILGGVVLMIALGGRH